MSARGDRLLGALVKRAREGYAVDLTDECKAAERYLAGKKSGARAKRQRAKSKPLPASLVHHAKSREAAKAQRLASLAVLRVVLLGETGGVCAVCPEGLTVETMELHHIVSGGLRRHRESRETTAPLCAGCHTGDGHNNPEVMAKLLAWCKATNRTEAARVLRRRLTKIEEARR